MPKSDAMRGESGKLRQEQQAVESQRITPAITPLMGGADSPPSHPYFGSFERIARKCAACGEEEQVQRQPQEQSATVGTQWPAFQPLRLFPKLEVGAVDDPQEREADQVAEQVVQRQQMGAAEPPEESPVMRLIQRQVQRAIQRKGMEGSFEPSAEFHEGLSAQTGKGASLDESTRSSMEQGFGADFSNVRIHTGPEAHQLNQQIQAKAFTTGSDIFFSKGAFDTQSTEGKKLLAHELTHTVQQGAVQRKAILRKPRIQRMGNVEGMTHMVTNGVVYIYHNEGRRLTTEDAYQYIHDQVQGGNPEFDIFKKIVRLGDATTPYPGSPFPYPYPCFYLYKKEGGPDFSQELGTGFELMGYVFPSKTIDVQIPEGGNYYEGLAEMTMAGEKANLEEFAGKEINQAGRISSTADNYQEILTTGLKVRKEPNAALGPMHRIRYDESVYVKCYDKHTGTWAYVMTGDGRAGWVNKDYLAIGVPDPASTLHHVQEGETLFAVMQKKYSKTYAVSTGDDFRIIAMAVVIANGDQNRLGISVDEEKFKTAKDDWVRETLDPWNSDNRSYFQSVELIAGTNIWLPGVDYIHQLKKEARIDTRPDWLSYGIGIAKGVGGFISGFYAGVYGELWNMLTGIVDLAQGIGTLIWKIISGEIVDDISALYDTVTNMTWEQGKEMALAVLYGLFDWLENFERDWNHTSPFSRWFFRGKVIGAIVLEIVLAIFTAGGGTAAKLVAKMGKVFPKLAKVLSKLMKGVDKIIPDKLKTKPKGHTDHDGPEAGDKTKRMIALGLAKSITEANDKMDTPIAGLMLALAPLKTKYRVSFASIPKGVPGHYRIVMRQEDEVDNDYSEKEEKKASPAVVGNIAKNAKKMSPDDIGEFLGAGKNWHKTSAKSKFLNKFKKELKGDTNADFYVDSVTREVFLKSNKSGNWISTGQFFE